jgi:hypothetical protein
MKLHFSEGESAASSDVELYTALRPALARVPGSIMIGISSPYRTEGLLYERWQRHYGADLDDVLVVRGSTLQFNPGFDQAIIAADMARDPDRFSAEYYSEWRTGLSDFFDREMVENAVDRGVRQRAPQHGVDYKCFVDTSAGRGDSFTGAIAHLGGEEVILDALFERRSPFNPQHVVDEVAAWVKPFGITHVAGDALLVNGRSNHSPVLA